MSLYQVMNENRYTQITSTSDYKIFTFISEGRHGKLTKFVRFDKLDYWSDTYNIALGTVLENGVIDYTGITNNGDRNRLLATVASIIFTFLEKNPGNAVYLTGSDLRRTLLYQRAINYAYEELIQLFNIEGDISTGEDFSEFEPFDTSKNYYGFRVKRK